MVRSRRALALSLAAVLGWAAAPQPFVVTPAVREVLNGISAGSLRGHVSFLASDELEGRDTPSRGLDVAAEYIAAQFRRAGLEPAGREGYFQTARLLLMETRPAALELTLSRGAESVRVEPGQAAAHWRHAIRLSGAPVYRLAGGTPPAAAEVAGKVVLADADRNFFRNLGRLRASGPAAIVALDRNGRVTGEAGPRLADPEVEESGPPVIFAASRALERLLESLPAGTGDAVADLRLEEPKVREGTARNVIAVLRGSDPALRDTYLLLSAHYDHIGMQAAGEGDRIYNGANDDASGTASLIEIAGALSRLRPRRSIVFLAFFGEERGSLGSRWYARHPAFPIARTVADINLEQLGRTDTGEGPRPASATFTGFDYSDIPAVFQAAGEVTGIRVFKDERNSDDYFSRSDNEVLAAQGIPAHTVCVAFEYPDYHGVDDEWEKLDYGNMARVDRMLALGLLMLAHDGQPPRWNEANSRTAAYVRAWKRTHGRAD